MGHRGNAIPAEIRTLSLAMDRSIDIMRYVFVICEVQDFDVPIFLLFILVLP